MIFLRQLKAAKMVLIIAFRFQHCSAMQTLFGVIRAAGTAWANLYAALKRTEANERRAKATDHALDVWSRHLADRIDDDDPVRLWRPHLSDVSVRREAPERLKPRGEIVGRHEVGELHP